MKQIFVLLSLYLLGCSESGEVYVQDKKILDTHIECMNLVVFPPNKEYESSLDSLYNFSENCPYQLILSYKTGIVCNSNQNYATKAMGMPSGYLRLELKKEGRLLYTYYKDLKTELNKEELQNGFEIISDDLDF